MICGTTSYMKIKATRECQSFIAGKDLVVGPVIKVDETFEVVGIEGKRLVVDHSGNRVTVWPPHFIKV